MNRVGHSAWSPGVLVYLEVAPDAPPSNLSAVVLNSTTTTTTSSAAAALVTWSPPPPDSSNGDLKGFKVSTTAAGVGVLGCVYV